MADDMINVAVDGEFRIPLKTIATAGYVWKLDSLPASIQLLKTENEKHSGESKPGDPNTQVFRFRALKAGEHTIKFILSRSWENKAIEARTVIVKAS